MALIFAAVFLLFLPAAIAAGLMLLLRLWRERLAPRTRIALSAFGAGLLPMAIPLWAASGAEDGGAAAAILFGAAVIALLVGLPTAYIMERNWTREETPPDLDAFR